MYIACDGSKTRGGVCGKWECSFKFAKHVSGRFRCVFLQWPTLHGYGYGYIYSALVRSHQSTSLVASVSCVSRVDIIPYALSRARARCGGKEGLTRPPRTPLGLGPRPSPSAPPARFGLRLGIPCTPAAAVSGRVG